VSRFNSHAFDEVGAELVPGDEDDDNVEGVPGCMLTRNARLWLRSSNCWLSNSSMT
jgi:hypothetical protein